MLGLCGIAVGVAMNWIPHTRLYLLGSLIIIFALLFYPVLNFWWIRESFWLRASALFFLASCLCVFGYMVDPGGSDDSNIPTVEQLKQDEVDESEKQPAPSAKNIADEITKNSQRPWIDFEVSLVGPLSYDDTRWNMSLVYQLKNTGKTVAKADFFAEILPFVISHWPNDSIKNGVPQGLPEPGTKTSAELRKMCNEASSRAQKMESFLGAPRMGIDLVSIDKETVGSVSVSGDPEAFKAAKDSQGYSGQFVLLACVVYNSELDSTMRKTAKAFALYKPNSPGIDIHGEVVQVEDLALVPAPMGGNFAD